MTDGYQNNMLRINCSSCGILFFTHYKSKSVCDACNPQSIGSRTVRSWGGKKLIQLDLFDAPLGYHCNKCGKGFSTMSEISKHVAHAHKKRAKKSINFVLEQYGMTAVIEVTA